LGATRRVAVLKKTLFVFCGVGRDGTQDEDTATVEASGDPSLRVTRGAQSAFSRAGV